MNEVTNITDYSVTIDGNTYSMLEIPRADSALIKSERERVLRNIDLEKLVTGLNRCEELLFLAYNGVAGFGELTAAMTKLHDNYGKLCGKCEIELGNIERQSAAILSKLKMVFTLLTKGKEKAAIEFLEKCGAVAKDLSVKALALSDEFDKLGNDAVEVLSNTQVVQGQQLDSKKKLEEQVQEYEANTAKAKKLVEGIAEQKKKLEDLYQQAKEQSEASENKAFALSIVGAIFKPIGEGVGAFAAVYSGGAAKAAANNLVTTSPSLPPTKAAAEDAKEKKEEELKKAEEELEDAKDEQEKTEDIKDAAEVVAEQKKEEAKTAQEKADKNKSNAKLKAEAELAATEADDAEEKLEQAVETAEKATKTVEKAEKKVSALKAALAAAGAAIKEAGEALANMGDNYSKIAEGYRKEKLQYLQMLMEKQDLERDALASIAEYAVRMKNTGAEIQTVELTCQSLFQAIGALKQVAVVLRLASHFWKNMATACENLAKSDLKDNIAVYSENFDVAERQEYYASTDFKEQVVRYYGGWKAIEVVSKEYAAESSKIMTKVHEDFKKNVSVEAARHLAIELGKKLAIDTTDDLATNGEAKQELEKEIEATEQLEAA